MSVTVINNRNYNYQIGSPFWGDSINLTPGLNTLDSETASILLGNPQVQNEIKAGVLTVLDESPQGAIESEFNQNIDPDSLEFDTYLNESIQTLPLGDIQVKKRGRPRKDGQ